MAGGTLDARAAATSALPPDLLEKWLQLTPSDPELARLTPEGTPVTKSTVRPIKTVDAGPLKLLFAVETL